MQQPTACPEGCFPARNTSQLDSLSTFWDALLNPNKYVRERDLCQWPTLWILFPTEIPSLEGEVGKLRVRKWPSRPAASLSLFLLYPQPTLSILQVCLLYHILFFWMLSLKCLGPPSILEAILDASSFKCSHRYIAFSPSALSVPNSSRLMEFLIYSCFYLCVLGLFVSSLDES